MTASRSIAVSVTRRSCILLMLEFTIEVLDVPAWLLPAGCGDGVIGTVVGMGLVLLLEGLFFSEE